MGGGKSWPQSPWETIGSARILSKVALIQNLHQFVLHLFWISMPLWNRDIDFIAAACAFFAVTDHVSVPTTAKCVRPVVSTPVSYGVTAPSVTRTDTADRKSQRPVVGQSGQHNLHCRDGVQTFPVPQIGPSTGLQRDTAWRAPCVMSAPMQATR